MCRGCCPGIGMGVTPTMAQGCHGSRGNRAGKDTWPISSPEARVLPYRGVQRCFSREIIVLAMPQAIAAINRCSLRAKQVLFSRAGNTETRNAAALNAAKRVQIHRIPATPAPVSAASGSGKTPTISRVLRERFGIREKPSRCVKRSDMKGVAVSRDVRPCPPDGGQGRTTALQSNGAVAHRGCCTIVSEARQHEDGWRQ